MARVTKHTTPNALPQFDIKSIFAGDHAKLYHRYTATLHLPVIAGGTPSDPKVAEGWLKTKLGLKDEDLVQEAVAQTMIERGVSADEAVAIVSTMKHLNGFKRFPTGELHIEGRHAKAMLKEACSVAVDTGLVKAKGYGLNTKKGLLSFFAETLFVEETDLGLGVNEPSSINQRFVHTWRGSGIQYEEICNDVQVTFTVASLHDYTPEEWAAFWVTAQQIGLGASRSQGYGKFSVTNWERLPGGPKPKPRKKVDTDADLDGDVG